MQEVTRILSAIEQGDQQGSEKLLPLVYEELRRLAAQRLSLESPGNTLQATALVHEAYVRLVDAEYRQQWDSRGHFFAAAAEAMRRILVESARRKGSIKRGGQMQRVELQESDAQADSKSFDNLLALDEALTRFAGEEPEKAELVKLRYFAGLSVEEASDALGVSRATAARYWTYARAWLYDALRE